MSQGLDSSQNYEISKNKTIETNGGIKMRKSMMTHCVKKVCAGSSRFDGFWMTRYWRWGKKGSGLARVRKTVAKFRFRVDNEAWRFIAEYILRSFMQRDVTNLCHIAEYKDGYTRQKWNSASDKKRTFLKINKPLHWKVKYNEDIVCKDRCVIGMWMRLSKNVREFLRS